MNYVLVVPWVLDSSEGEIGDVSQQMATIREVKAGAATDDAMS